MATALTGGTPEKDVTTGTFVITKDNLDHARWPGRPLHDELPLGFRRGRVRPGVSGGPPSTKVVAPLTSDCAPKSSVVQRRGDRDQACRVGRPSSTLIAREPCSGGSAGANTRKWRRALDAGPLLEARGIVRHFGHVFALQGADFTVYPSEIVALIGDNGAGKSTLVKILAGSDHPTEGEIRVDGKPIHLNTPQDARAVGIETVYQDLALAPDLDAAANVFLGRELLRSGFLGRLGVLDKRAMTRQTSEAVARLGVSISANSDVATLSGGQRQSVAVARAALWASRVIFMDEPTAALGPVQTKNVLDLIRRVRDAGIAVVLISHNMTQVLEVATDRSPPARTDGRADQDEGRHSRGARRGDDRGNHQGRVQ